MQSTCMLGLKDIHKAIVRNTERKLNCVSLKKKIHSGPFTKQCVCVL